MTTLTPQPADQTINWIHTPPFGEATIKKIIPHRYPFLLIDRILELGWRHMRAYKNLSLNEEVFQGHFPNHPVYPGVLHIESLAQMGAVWILNQEQNRGLNAFLLKVEEARFRRPVGPGDRLELFGQITHLKARTGRMEGRITVDGKTVSESTVMFSLVPMGANNGAAESTD